MSLLSFIRKISGGGKVTSPAPEPLEEVEWTITAIKTDFTIEETSNNNLEDFENYKDLHKPAIIKSYLISKDGKALTLSFVQYSHLLHLGSRHKSISTEDRSVYLFFIVKNNSLTSDYNKRVKLDTTELFRDKLLIRLDRKPFKVVDTGEQIQLIFNLLK
jgi:hypothetical protein